MKHMKPRLEIRIGTGLALLFVLLFSPADGSLWGYQHPPTHQWAYISHLEGDVTIEREGKTPRAAAVNRPVANGDRIITNGGGRCELKFQNSSLARLNENSSIEIHLPRFTPGIAEDRSLGLTLSKGEIYLSCRLDRGDRMIVNTSGARIQPDNESRGWINADFPGEVQLYVLSGKMTVQRAFSNHPSRERVIHSQKGCRIDKSGKFSDDYGRNREFLWWNESLDKDAGKPHHGLEAVPGNLGRYPGGVRDFIKTFSTTYGRWIRHDIFGFIWRPDDPAFHSREAPFKGGASETAGGRVFLIPAESWGWVPAHAGIWVLLKQNGWCWIPGDHAAPAPVILDELLIPFYGSYALYSLSRTGSPAAWKRKYLEKYGKYPVKPGPENTSRQAAEIIRLLNAASLSAIESAIRFSLFK